MTDLVVPFPWTRINDAWIQDGSINAEAPQQSVRDALISPDINAWAPQRFQPQHYKQIACDIVAESTYHYPYAYVSEKTLRPMACKRMFILLASPGVLSLLHSKGFETFGDFVDESYDAVLDPGQRFHAVVREVRRFCARPLPEILQYLDHIRDRLEHNFMVLRNLEELEIQAINQLHD